jgi:hypothetical protein
MEVWNGASGALYPYTVVEIGRQPNTAFGNYIFSKLNRAGWWVAIYVGHGDLSHLADLDQHRMRDFIRRQGATHVHIHENPSMASRMIERMDILEAHPEAAANSRYQGTIPA